MMPQDWRALTPMDWRMLVDARNAADGGDDVEPPTRDEFEELMRRYV